MWFITVCIKCQIKVCPRMKDDYILNWRSWPGERGMKRGCCTEIEAWQSPYLAILMVLKMFTYFLLVRTATWSLIWFAVHSPSHRDFLSETTSLFVLRKQPRGFWNPAISLAPFQLHVLPLGTGSSIRVKKCKGNVSPIFSHSNVEKFQELKKAQCVSYVFYPLACVSNI